MLNVKSLILENQHLSPILKHPVHKRARVYHVTWYIGDNQYFSIYSYQITAEHFLQGSTLLSSGTEQWETPSSGPQEAYTLVGKTNFSMSSSDKRNFKK